MSRKRRNTSSPESDDIPPSKRLQSIPSTDDEELDFDDPQDTKEQPRLNQEFGLHNAFPGLDVDDEELFYGPAADGIDYLRMVRSEAKGVPSLLVAKEGLHLETWIETDQDDGDNEAEHGGGGFYFDGTYTAAASKSESFPALPRAQTQYYERLLWHFHSLRALLRRVPPADAIQNLDDFRPITLPPDSKTARSAWQRHILNLDPHPVQVASIGSDSVLELVKLMGMSLGKFLEARSEKTRERVASWVWALLARFPDRGELGGDEIADLRGLASTAVRLLRTGRNEPTDQEVESSEEDNGIGAAVTAALAAGPENQDGFVGPEQSDADVESSQAKPVLLDAIITIIGEVYGQRDLLEYRETWFRVDEG